jgi:uncharacterized protein YraI
MTRILAPGLPILRISCHNSPMRNLTATLCLTIAVILGNAGCTTNSGQEPTPKPNVVPKKTMSGLEVLFIEPEVTLRSGPGIRFPMKRVLKKADGKRAVLLQQKKSWMRIHFEGRNFWVHSSFIDRHLRPGVMEVLFKVSDVNFRSGPGVRFPKKGVLKESKGKRAVPFGESGQWVNIVFERHPYWVHSSLIQRYKPLKKYTKSSKYTKKPTYLQNLKRDAAAGDSKAMKMLGLFYGNLNNLHLEISYMWLSLAIGNAAPEDNVSIQKHLEEYIIPKLRDAEIARAERRMKRCKEPNYTDCADVFKSFQRK